MNWQGFAIPIKETLSINTEVFMHLNFFTKSLM